MSEITTSSETSGDNFTFNTDGQVLVVDEGVSLISDTGDAVHSENSGSQVTNYGNVYGGDIGIDLADKDAENNVVINAASGALAGGEGIITFGKGDLIVNAGSVTAFGFAALGVAGDNSTISNVGTVYAHEFGAAFVGAKDVLVNTGTITADSVGVGLLPSQTAAPSLTITNTGTIQGGSLSIVVAGTGTVTINNRGTLGGRVQLGDGSDTLGNSGHIFGAVNLGNGTNSFDGRGGSVEGTITGGSGVDTVTLGNDGETVQGNGGHDVLTAGAGADTFVFTTTSASSSDTVHGFDAAHDLIHLAHSAFTALVPGRAPVFAISNHATSAADHLFYNATTGGLFYDADGSGTAHAANLLAHLDPELKLTAKNFDVV